MRATDASQGSNLKFSSSHFKNDLKKKKQERWILVINFAPLNLSKQWSQRVIKIKNVMNEITYIFFFPYWVFKTQHVFYTPSVSQLRLATFQAFKSQTELVAAILDVAAAGSRGPAVSDPHFHSTSNMAALAVISSALSQCPPYAFSVLCFLLNYSWSFSMLKWLMCFGFPETSSPIQGTHTNNQLLSRPCPLCWVQNSVFYPRSHLPLIPRLCIR